MSWEKDWAGLILMIDVDCEQPMFWFASQRNVLLAWRIRRRLATQESKCWSVVRRVDIEAAWSSVSVTR